MTTANVYQTPTSELDQGDQDELIFAGFWVRVGASIIDTVLILLITLPLVTAIYGKEYWLSESLVNGVWDFLISYILPAVVVILFWLYKSATPGKMMLRLEVISLGKTKKLSVGQSIGRYIAYYPSMLVFLIGIIWVAFDKRKQGWHDKLANTAVVKKRRNA